MDAAPVNRFHPCVVFWGLGEVELEEAFELYVRRVDADDAPADVLSGISSSVSPEMDPRITVSPSEYLVTAR